MTRAARCLLVTGLVMVGYVALAIPAAAQHESLAARTADDALAPRISDAIEAPAVIVTANPPAFETVEVLRPHELPRGAAGYVVTSTSNVKILGRLAGVLSPDSSGAGSVLLTFSLPHRVPAGIVEVARVRFTVDGATPVDVPVRIRVAAATDIDLYLADGASWVLRGERMTVRYTIVNAGNRSESVAVDVVAPAGWSHSSSLDSIALAMREVVAGAVELSVPDDASTGLAVVRLIASVDGSPVAQAEARVSVLAAGVRHEEGPVLKTGVTVGSGVTGEEQTWSAQLSGPLTPGIRVSGRLSRQAAPTSSGNLALYRLGAFQQPDRLALEADRWALRLGYGGAEFGQLTGTGVSGNGIASTVRGDWWSVATLLGRPGWANGVTSFGGQLIGARTELDMGPALVAASGTHLFERGYEERALDALGVGVTFPSAWSGTLTTEVAQRHSLSGSNVGFSATFDRQTADDNLSIRVLHAPGGRSAFAQAAELLSAGASHRLTDRIGVSADYWASHDEGAGALSAVSTSGASGGVWLGLTNSLRARLAVRRSGLDASGAAGGTSSSDEGLEATLDFRRSRVFASVRSEVGTRERQTIVPDELVPLSERGRRLRLEGAVQVRAGGGTVALLARHERSDPASGSIPQRSELTLRVERLALFTRGRIQLLANAEIQKSYLPGFGPLEPMLAAGLEARLPGDFTVSWAAERNPWYATAGFGPSWAYALRVERRTPLPPLRANASRGVVYRDLNGNGRRDAGEPGHPGAVVRRNGISTVSAADGGFVLPGAGGNVSLDPMSLDAGWITGRARSVSGREEIAVIPLSPIAIVLRVVDAQGLGIASDTLREATIVARHESGRVWVARRTAPDSAIFDALPPGRYEVELDLSDVRVPLNPADALPSFAVTQGARLRSIRIVLVPRRLKIRTLDPPPPERRR